MLGLHKPPIWLAWLCLTSLPLPLVAPSKTPGPGSTQAQQGLTASHGTSSQHQHQKSLETLLRAAATVDPAVLVAVADEKGLVSSLPFVLSSLAASAPALQLADHLIVVVRGRHNKILCDSLHRLCWQDDVLLEGKDGLAKLNWRKAEVAAVAVALGIGAFTVDLDLVFLQNPFNLLQEPQLRQLDYFAQPEAADTQYSYDEAWVNVGFHYFAPTSGSQRLLDSWLTNQSAWDQTAMQSLLLSKNVTGLRWHVLDSTQARSLCHLDSAISLLSLETGNFANAARKYFMQQDPQWDRAYFYHFPCCSEPSATTCKSIMASLVLEFWLAQHPAHADTHH